MRASSVSASVVGVVTLALLAGCASRGSVRRVERELAAVSTQLGELGKLNESTGRDLARAIAELRELQSGATKLNREEGEVVRKLSRVEERLAAAEGTIRELRASFVELAREVNRAVEIPARDSATREQAARRGSPEQLYAAALATMRAGEHGQAVLDFLDLIAKYPRHPLAGNAQYWIGEAYYLQRDFRQALVEFQHVVTRYGKNGKAADALLKIGLCYRSLHEPLRAQETWRRLVAEFPGTEAARRARALMQASPASSARSR